MKLLFKVLLVLVVAGAGWAKWTGYLVEKLEVTDYSCSGNRRGQMVFNLTLKNIWDRPLSLTASGLFIYGDGPGNQTAVESPVLPDPLPPGQLGQLTFGAPVPLALVLGGEFNCWIRWIRDGSGRKVRIIQPDSVIVTW